MQNWITKLCTTCPQIGTSTSNLRYGRVKKSYHFLTHIALKTWKNICLLEEPRNAKYVRGMRDRHSCLQHHLLNTFSKFHPWLASNRSCRSKISLLSLLGIYIWAQILTLVGTVQHCLASEWGHGRAWQCEPQEIEWQWHSPAAGSRATRSGKDDERTNWDLPKILDWPNRNYNHVCITKVLPLWPFFEVAHIPSRPQCFCDQT